ncbi:pheromone-regulated membrane protein [Aspergillus sclerotioniger CBS 115572]|uniref:Pheromone-regulated membrane protein n=1 Tax=Aspergillus sclerotioniger CBS 115572 TaxID=1450535 RepID=A0A317V7S0_9EURO|nr:pheromone-regulated membrane protein [Aspergillus sclerotioniger CBS 115572]PWY69017.1 pheromone-regulated membrane protein [Aspergillus sclerotioniger CBS 115572]
MFCSGDREKGPVALEEQWDYINLDDFKSESCLSPFSYFFLYVFLAISIAVYGVDTFTAVNLLAFSRWAGSIEPAIPFKISRWIFAVCIIISFALLAYRWMRAIRAMRSGSIAHSFLDSLAVRIQSIRMGRNGRGWRRFLVFAELAKSKKGAEYVALFAYFAFESWMSTIFADGPRQVVNAITLYSVMQMDLLPGGKNTTDEGGSTASQLFYNIKMLAEDNTERAVVLIGMLFTLVIWVLSMLKLFLAVVLYLIFLFHHIPSEDGSLKAYCRRKINTRLTRIVRRKVNKALAKGVVLQDRKPTNPNMGLDKRPTLPSVGVADDDKTPIVTTISRTTTQTTLPAYSSRPGTAAPDRKPTLPDVGAFNDKHSLTRTMTESSAYSDAYSLSGSTAVSGYSPLDRHGSAPPVPPLPNQGPAPMPRAQTPRIRQNANQPLPGPGYNSPMERSSPAPSMPRSHTPMSYSDTAPATRLPSQMPGPVPRLQTPVSRQGFTQGPQGPGYGYGPVDRASPAPQIPHMQTPVSNIPPAPGYGPVDRASPAPRILHNQTPVPRTNFTPAPATYGPSMPSGLRSRGPTEEYNPFETYGSHVPPSGTPFRPYSPAVDPYTRSLTSGPVLPSEGVPNRTFSPLSQSHGLPYPPHENEYPLRSLTPSSSGGIRSPAGGPDGMIDRTFSPVGSIGAGGYVAFNPAARSSPMPFNGDAVAEHDEYAHGHAEYPYDTKEPRNGYVAFNPQQDRLSPDSDLASPFDEHHGDEHVDIAHESGVRQFSPIDSAEAAPNQHNYIAFNPLTSVESHFESTEHMEYADSHVPNEDHNHEFVAADPAESLDAPPLSDSLHDVPESHGNYVAFNPAARQSTESGVFLPSDEHHEEFSAEPEHSSDTRPVSLLSPNDSPTTNDGYIAFNPENSPSHTEPEHRPSKEHHTEPVVAAENPFESSADVEETRPSNDYVAFSPSVRSPMTPTTPITAPLEHNGSPARSMFPRDYPQVQPYRPDHF